MKNMIEELYYGNIDPQGCGYRPNSSVKRASDLVTDLEEELLKRLDVEDKDLFFRFCNAYVLRFQAFLSSSGRSRLHAAKPATVWQRPKTK